MYRLNIRTGLILTLVLTTFAEPGTGGRISHAHRR